MDTFVEHLVKRQSSSADTLKKVGIVVAAVILFVLLLFASPFLGPFSFFAVAAACGVVFGAYWLITRMNVEYEYILTGDEIDVDKIIAQRKRKRLLTVKVGTFERFAPYNPDMYDPNDFDNCVMACIAPDDPETYCAVFQHPTLGHTLLIFNPDDRILEGVKHALPRRRKQDEDSDWD